MGMFGSSPPRPVQPAAAAPTQDDPKTKALADAAAASAKDLANRRRGYASNLLTPRPGIGAPRGLTLLGGGNA